MQSAGSLYELDSLREIAWRLWDPIGLRDLRDHHVDEYDAYILQAAGHAVRGRSLEDLGEFLSSCCHEMGVRPDEAAALRTARALIALVDARRAVPA